MPTRRNLARGHAANVPTTPPPPRPPAHRADSVIQRSRSRSTPSTLNGIEEVDNGHIGGFVGNPATPTPAPRSLSRRSADTTTSINTNTTTANTPLRIAAARRAAAAAKAHKSSSRPDRAQRSHGLHDSTTPSPSPSSPDAAQRSHGGLHSSTTTPSTWPSSADDITFGLEDIDAATVSPPRQPRSPPIPAPPAAAQGRHGRHDAPPSPPDITFGLAEIDAAIASPPRQPRSPPIPAPPSAARLRELTYRDRYDWYEAEDAQRPQTVDPLDTLVCVRSDAGAHEAATAREEEAADDDGAEVSLHAERERSMQTLETWELLAEMRANAAEVTLGEVEQWWVRQGVVPPECVLMYSRESGALVFRPRRVVLRLGGE